MKNSRAKMMTTVSVFSQDVGMKFIIQTFQWCAVHRTFAESIGIMLLSGL